MEPVYLISNVHRSGSSMMMRCLTESGLKGVYNEDIEKQIFLDDYHPNPNGFFENTVTLDEITKQENCVLKCGFRKALKLPIGNYKIVFIKRNPNEIRKSMLSFTPFRSWGDDMVVLEFYDEIMDYVIDTLKSRKDVDLTVLNYSEIISDPLKEFNKLIINGWPIDPVKAASLVDESLYRLKLEKDGK